MTALQYKLNPINASGTTVIAAAGNITVHTVSFPRATVGTTIFSPATGAAYQTFPIGSIGCMILDAAYPSGLSVFSGSAQDFITVTTDTP